MMSRAIDRGGCRHVIVTRSPRAEQLGRSRSTMERAGEGVWAEGEEAGWLRNSTEDSRFCDRFCLVW